jgi:hypothetical protein
VLIRAVARDAGRRAHESIDILDAELEPFGMCTRNAAAGRFVMWTL